MLFNIILLYNVEVFFDVFDSCNSLQELILTENSLVVNYACFILSTDLKNLLVKVWLQLSIYNMSQALVCYVIVLFIL